MPCRVVVSLLGFLVLVAAAVSPATAQTDTARISGQVADADGRSVPKADVRVANVATSVVSTATTNDEGIYSVVGLIPGRYRIVVQKAGFREVIVDGLTLNVQDVVAQNVQLQIGSVSESVTVNANGLNMNTTDAAVSTIVDRRFVENVPLNGRSFQDLLTLTPGVTIAPSYAGSGFSGEITVNGQRTEANYFTVDGVSANVGALAGSNGTSGAGVGGGIPAETALGTTQSIVSIDALQEFRATTSTYSAEFGRTPGGQFAFTTRSGTNDWHGSAFDYFRNDVLDANNWFNNALGFPREKERQNDFGGTLGGPIWIPGLYNGKDKTFFFFSYEGLRLWTPQGVQTHSVPDQALRQQAPAALQPILNAFPLPNAGEDGLNDGLGIYQAGPSFPSSIDSVSVRLDHNFTDKLRIFGRYADTPTSSSDYFDAVKRSSIFNNRLLTVGVTNLLTAKQSNELHFNITQANSFANNVSTSQGGATPFSLTTLPGPNGASLPSVGSTLTFWLSFGGGAIIPGLLQQKSTERQYNVVDTYSWLLGRHSLKFGVDWRRLTTYVVPRLALEFVSFPSKAAVLANNVGPAASGGIIRSASDSPSPVEPVYKNFSAFVGDEWKATERLSLSFGLRWEINPAPGNLTGPPFYTLNQITNLATAALAPAGTPLWKTDWHAFAPRFGGAYQLGRTSGRETVLRAGFGVFYDLGNTMGSSNFGALGFASRADFHNVSFPLSSAQMNLPPPSIAIPYSDGIVAFNPNLKLPYTLQWNVALEQVLGAKQTLTVSYVGSAGRRLLQSLSYSPGASYGNANFLGGCDCPVITDNGPSSDYDALQVKFQRRVTHGLQALASYTFSHSIDNSSTNFFVLRLLERSSSDFDVRHSFQAAVSYDIPGNYSRRTLSAIASHWSLDARMSAQSALPVDVYASNGIDPATNALVNFHPNLVPGQRLYLYGSQYPGGRVINYNAFTVPASGVGPGATQEGDTPRNFARGLGNWQLNIAIRREFPINEKLRLQFRTEAFNLFNHANFGGVLGYLPSGPFNPTCLCGFGVPQGTLNTQLNGLNALYQIGGPRSLQLALKLVF